MRRAGWKDMGWAIAIPVALAATAYLVGFVLFGFLGHGGSLRQFVSRLFH
jgi:hypothetical protein